MSIGDLLEFKKYADDVAAIICYVVAIASIIVRLTPTLRDNNALLPVIKWLSKWIAWNRTCRDDIERLKKYK